MIANALHRCISRLRDLGTNSKTAHSHAMPFNLLPSATYDIGNACINVFVPITIVAGGISVPSSRGGPPIFNE